MQGTNIRLHRSSRIRAYTGFAILITILMVLAGCASTEKVEPVEPIAPPEIKGPSVVRLDNGREGFIITEIPQMDAASRRDFNHAVALLKKQDYEQAIEVLEKVIEQSPGVTAPYVDLAIAYQGIEEMEKAEESLKKALDVFPDHPVVCNEFGLLYRRTGRFTEAKSIYEKAISSFPEYSPVHKNLGILCDLYLNDPDCALDHYEIYSKANPEDEQVKIWIADLSARFGRN